MASKMNPQMQLSFRRVVLLLSLVLVVGVVHAEGMSDPCTPTTCPPGPVMATFASPNCSGDPVFTSYGTEMGTCQGGTSPSLMYIETAESVSYLANVNNPSCDLTLDNSTYIIYQHQYGKCNFDYFFGRDEQVATSTWMILPNVNATYTSPQPPPTIITSYPSIQTKVTNNCAQPGNCTHDGQKPVLEVVRYDRSCSSIRSASAVYNISMDGTCYINYESGYVSYYCLGEHEYVAHYYTGEGCQNLVYSEYRRSVCVPNAFVPLSYNCHAPPFSPTVPSAPSDPSVPSTASVPASYAPSEPSDHPAPSDSSAPTMVPSAPSASIPTSAPSDHVTPSATPTSAASSLLPPVFLIVTFAMAIF